MEHLRYPEDMFKVQRYQFARYHVTDAVRLVQRQQPLGGPEDPNSTSNLQPPYRLFVDEPQGRRGRLLADLDVRALQQEQPRGLRVRRLRRDVGRLREDQGAASSTTRAPRVPGQIANDFISDTDVADQLAQFNRSGGQVIYGNLLTLPIDDGLIYVEPVYAVRRGLDRELPEPGLRAGLLQRRGRHRYVAAARPRRRDRRPASRHWHPSTRRRRGRGQRQRGRAATSRPTGSWSADPGPPRATLRPSATPTRRQRNGNTVEVGPADGEGPGSSRRRPCPTSPTSAPRPSQVRARPRARRPDPIWPAGPHPVRLVSPTRGGAAR